MTQQSLKHGQAVIVTATTAFHSVWKIGESIFIDQYLEKSIIENPDNPGWYWFDCADGGDWIQYEIDDSLTNPQRKEFHTKQFANLFGFQSTEDLLKNIHSK